MPQAPVQAQALVSEPSFIQRSQFLPTEIWVTDWTASSSSSPSHPITIETLAESVYESAAGEINEQLLISSHDLESLVLAFENVISDCVLANDFTQLLLPNRTFQM
jgi:hypothetical protein